MSKFCRKITAELNDIEEVCKLYLSEEEIDLNEEQFEKYISAACNVYLKMLNNGSYTFDIVNISLHFFLKNVRPYAASCKEA